LAGNLDRVKKGLGDKSEKGNRVEGFAMDNGLLTTHAQVSFLLAIDTAAVLLPIKIQFFRFLDTFLPTVTQISMDEGDPTFLSRFLAELANQFMILSFAVKQGGGKTIHAALFGQFCGCV
jgi:hypothetical protein